MSSYIVKAKPTSPGRRFVVQNKNAELHKGKPFKSLVKKKSKTGGRNNLGRITCRHRGGGHKQHYRQIDFKRIKDNVPAIVERIEYDPNRSANIALLKYIDGARAYILATKKMTLGQKIISGTSVPIEIGNSMPISSIPLGTVVCCVEMKPQKGAQLARSAGTSVQVVAKEGEYATLKLRSGEMRKVLLACRATIGEIGNEKHNLISLGKAGASRWRGIRPTVRGVAMNPVDHPHGGGEGKTSGGRHPVSPTGVPTKGYRTRSNKVSSRLIVRSRHKNKK